MTAIPRLYKSACPACEATAIVTCHDDEGNLYFCCNNCRRVAPIWLGMEKPLNTSMLTIQVEVVPEPAPDQEVKNVH